MGHSGAESPLGPKRTALWGRERDWLVKTGVAAANTGQVLSTTEQVPSLIAVRHGDDESRSEETFEAIIVRLDGAAAERLLRLVEE